MRCTHCGADARASARFCEDCGERLELRCPACDAVATPGKRFCGDCGARLDVRNKLPAAPPPAATPAREDERRWATILFADISGFTAMSERMDPEDVKALAHRCSEQMAAAVRDFGGTVLNVMGDAIVAVFGAPIAHEDDAERAVPAPGWRFETAS